MQINNHNNIIPEKQASSPNFKSMAGVLNVSGRAMQQIEDWGFLGSFLIQDGIGMTAPRTVAGFMRDKEVTGKYNKQEGLEVFGREGLTGPCMMAVAPLMLLIAAKFGRSTSVNSQLIKRFGNNLKEMIAKPEFDKALLKTPDKFKQEFYKANIEKILADTVGKENAGKDSVEYIMKQLANYENIPAGVPLKKFRGKAKYRTECMNNIVEHINNLKYASGEDLNMLGKVKAGADKKVFSTKNTFDAMMKYTDDAITANKHLDKLDVLAAENIKNRSIAKRIITNISTMAATLGVLSVLPKIYARSNVAPGARKNVETESNQNVTFKGKEKADLLAKMGKKISSSKKYEKLSSELEYNGHNFTNSLMAGLSIFGLLTPRGLRAYNRAQVDENGKKDLTELYEIFIRDLTSSLAVVFAVPMGTRACVTAYEKKSGFVLMEKDRSMSKAKTVLDLFNPYSKAHVMTNAEIASLYDRIDSQAKMLNFCKYIDKNGGDLQKIISKSEELKTVFNESTIDFNSLKGMSKSDKNKKIISFFENFKENAKKLGKGEDKKALDEMIAKLMKGAGSKGGNKIAAFARGLNSVPGLLTTFLISPYLLGWAIPRLTYKNTRRIHEKQDRERELNAQQKLKASA